MLTLAQIHAAQTNDLAGISAVLTEMDERVKRLAASAARRLSDHGHYREDFEQDAREALFMALPRVTGDSVDRAIGFLYASIEDALKDRVRAIRYQGADKDAVKVFTSMLARTDGDAHKAEVLAQTEPPKGVRLGADRAQAARIAWQGSVYLDRPTGEGEASLADTLAAPQDDAPDVVRPKVGRGAVLEALSVIERYVTVPTDADAREGLLKALDTMATGYATPDAVEALSEAVRVPADPTTRRLVLDAVAILHSSASTATDGAVADDLRDVSDDLRDERAVKHLNVSAALDRMGDKQRDILRYSFGIGGAEDFGWGDAGDLEGLAEFLGMTTHHVKTYRSKARVSFVKYYVAIVARTEAEALALADAAAANRTQAGRK